MKVFVFGNTDNPSDSLPVKFIPKLRKKFKNIDFVHVDPNEDWYKNEKELIILDTVVGLENVKVFNSLDAFETISSVTPHDYDLYVDLKLLLKIDYMRKVTIVGIPPNSQNNSLAKIINSLELLVNRNLNNKNV